MADDRLDGPAAEAFLSGALALARDAAVSPTWFEASVRALEAAYGERPLLPAPTLAFDLTALMNGERLSPVAPSGIEVVREALRVYEDHVLARLTADRRWTRVTEAMTAAPKELRAAAVGMTVSQLLHRLNLSGGTGVSTGVVRRFASRPSGEVLEAGRVALWSPQLAGRLAEGLHQLARAARRTRELMGDAEVFVIENIAALKGLGPRVALSQLAEVAQEVGERLPPRLRAPTLDHGDAPTRLEEDSTFPVGGFSSIATTGSLENLVTSELIYMEQGIEAHARPDLFDVRFVENELLYYARDESVAVRRRSVLVLVFDASLLRARVKDATETYQRLTWALGSVTALVRKLSEWLNTEALTFELIFVGAHGEAPLDEERSVLTLLLREYRERGQLELLEAADSLAAVRDARGRHQQGARVMLFATRMPGGLEGDAAPDAFIDAGGSRPVVYWSEGASTPGEPANDALEAWAQVTRQLLDGLLRRRRAKVVDKARSPLFPPNE
jgi:hypothetical protein